MPLQIKSGGRRLSFDVRASGDWIVLTIREDGIVTRIPMRAPDAAAVLDLLRNAHDIVTTRQAQHLTHEVK